MPIQNRYFAPNSGSYTVSFAAANPTPPSAVQPVPGGPFTGQDYRIINSGSNLVMLGWAPTAAGALASAQSAPPTQVSLPLLPGTDEILTFPPGTWFTGMTTSGSSTVYITVGDGS